MYVDTSALVKLYVDEPDSDACEATVAGNSLASSSLLYCEFRSALLGKLSRMLISRAFLDEDWMHSRTTLPQTGSTSFPSMTGL